ncbi:MAG: DUF3604 domain-containing protein [Pseudomonadales bacterium]|nr:DUF3604 domain-containing protein [Pseudomonadales bacterium]
MSLRSLTLILLALATLLVLPTAGADYLAPELRASVEKLKADYRAAPTRPETYPARARVAWDWLNAYAMTGKSVPVNITTAVRPVVPERVRRGDLRNLDYYLEELILLDEEPDALGTLTADLGPFESRTFVEIHQRYTVGKRNIKQGGGFVIAHHFMPGYGAFQVTDPAGKNYVTITSDNQEVRFAPDAVPIAGMHGGFRGAAPGLAFRVTAGELKTGDTVTVTYGDRSGGGPGLRMGPASTDFLPIPIYVSFDNSDHAYALPIQPIKVSGTDIDAVHIFVPSVVRPGEAFDISVRAQDRYYNRAKAPIPPLNVMVNGKPFKSLPQTGDAITIIKGARFDEPGVYRFSATSADGQITGVSDPMLVSADARKIYWGDTHGHSGFAEGIGTPDRFMQWAKEDARLDFVTHSEHDIWMDDFEWNKLINNVEKYSEPGRFIAYPGYEWTARNIYGGHHNVLFRNTKDRRRIPTQFYPLLSDLYQGLRDNYDTDDVLIIPHAHQAGDYRQNDPTMERLVEIMSHHGTFEWFGKMYLSHGHQVGFVAASDDHLSQPGYTGPWSGVMAQRGGLAAVRATENTRDGIFDAMKALHTYATTGDRIIADVTLNGAEMGERTAFAETRKIEGRVIGTAPIDTITIVKNGQDIWHRDYLTAQSGRYKDTEHFYVSFESPSVPMNPNDNPRGARSWIGTLEITGAEIESFEATDFFNPDLNVLKRDEKNPGLIHFATGSRGDVSSIKLTLRNVKRSAKALINIEPALEYGSPTVFRPSKTTPASSVTLRFKDIDDGQVSEILPFDIYDDRITLRRVIEDGPDDVSFSFEDQGNLQGDYYYVRIKQANDASAWTSPIWVGGFPHQ